MSEISVETGRRIRYFRTGSGMTLCMCMWISCLSAALWKRTLTDMKWILSFSGD